MIRPLHLALGVVLVGGVACLPVARSAVAPRSDGSRSPDALRVAPAGATSRPAMDAAAALAPRSAPQDASGESPRNVISAPMRAPGGDDAAQADALSRVLRDQVRQARRRAGLQVLDRTGRVSPGSQGVWYVSAPYPTRA